MGPSEPCKIGTIVELPCDGVSNDRSRAKCHDGEPSLACFLSPYWSPQSGSPTRSTPLGGAFQMRKQHGMLGPSALNTLRRTITNGRAHGGNCFPRQQPSRNTEGTSGEAMVRVV